MSKSRIVKNPNKLPSIPSGSTSRPPGALSLATSNNQDLLADAIRYGNRATRRLATQKAGSSNYRKLMKSGGGVL